MTTRIRRVQNHDEALRLWHEAGAAQRILVHIDAHPDVEWVGGFVNIANFICPALQRGMIKRLDWIVPDPSWHDRRALVAYLRALAARYPAPRAPVRIHDDELTTSLLGIPVHVRALAGLARFDEPVLLDVDTDFLLIARIPDSDRLPPPARPWLWPEELVRRLRDQDLTTDLVTIAYSTEGGYTPLLWKYLGDELADRLEHPDAPSARWLMQREATLAFTAGQLHEASEGFRRLLTDDPSHASAAYGLAQTLAAQGQPETARTQYQRSVGLDPTYHTRFDALAMRHLTSGQLEEARRACRQMQTLDPDDPYPVYVAGRIAAAEHRWAEALGFFRDAARREPQFLDAQLAAAHALAQLGRLEEAVMGYERALTLGLTPASTTEESFISTEPTVSHRITRNHFTAYATLSRLYARLNRIPDAITSYRFWLAANRSHTPGDWLWLAQLHARRWRRTAA